ncbi:MAG TPA: hypothetical protein VF533_01220, partial [Solirubrobacteraceae bacterium]
WATRDISPAARRAFRAARAIADGTAAVRAARRRHPGLQAGEFSRTADRLELIYQDRGRDVIAVDVDLAARRVLATWTGAQIRWGMARGSPEAFGRWWSSPWVVLPLGLLFLTPFVDPRRPWRLLHLDLLMLLAFGVSHLFFNAGRIGVSVPLVYPVLLYLAVRMLFAAFRPREPAGPLVPHASAKLLGAGLVALLAARIVLDVAGSSVIDVGYAGVIGADHILDGEGLYGPQFADDPPNGDTYGPLTYLLYVPFRLLLGWSGRWDALPAAHGAAIAFDLATVAALLWLGRRLRPGAAGRLLGLALAWAWAANPYTAFVLSANANDALVALFCALALGLAASPAGRAVAVAFGGGAKLAPFALAPLFAWTARPAPRSLAVYGLTFAAVTAATFLPFVPDGGVRELYDRTLGFQAGRSSPFSVWGQEPALHGLHTVVKIVVVDFALLLAVWPPRPSPRVLAALGAVVLLGLQMAVTHWFYLYVPWVLPFVLAALFLGRETAPRGGAPAPAAGG